MSLLHECQLKLNISDIDSAYTLLMITDKDIFYMYVIKVLYLGINKERCLAFKLKKSSKTLW